MKRIISVLLVALLLMPVAYSEEAEATPQPVENVVNMSIHIWFPGKVRWGEYTGEALSYKPHGYGIFTAINDEGVTYHCIGNWENGKMNGDGGMYWSNGYMEIGTFADNELICGDVYGIGYHYWIDYRPNEHGCYNCAQYRTGTDDRSVIFEGCMNPSTLEYHMGTIYRSNGEVFFTGEMGEGFNWDLLLIN